MRAHLAKAAFAQHLVEHQVINGEVLLLSGTCGQGGAWAHTLTRFPIGICNKHIFAQME